MSHEMGSGSFRTLSKLATRQACQLTIVEAWTGHLAARGICIAPQLLLNLVVLKSEQQGVRCRAYLLSPYLQAWTPTEKATAVHTYLRSTTWQNHSFELITPMTAVIRLRHRSIVLTCSASSAARMTNFQDPIFLYILFCC